MNDPSHTDSNPLSVSRRSFLKGLGLLAVTTATSTVSEAADQLGSIASEKVSGPGPVPVTLQVNGQQYKLNLEPRVTLLDALRNRLPLTGSKEVCDRATCGACTVLMDDVPVYSCSKLAIEAQGHKITTIEGLAKDGKLTPVQQEFVECDASMCGYCTPGFVMSVTALLKKNPHPTENEVRTACSGNLCRCGTQPRVIAAALKASGVKVTERTEVISHGKLA
jgi:aerobic-type carbon monoxide dehydrogenase small subunit (CoxS/CutS family)